MEIATPIGAAPQAKSTFNKKKWIDFSFPDNKKNVQK